VRGDLPIPRSGTTGQRRGELPRSKPARLCGDRGSGEPCRSKAPSICIGEASVVRFGAPARERGRRSGSGAVPKPGRRRVSTPTLAPPRSDGGGGRSPSIRWRQTRTRWPWRCCAPRSPLPRPPLGPAAGAMVSQPEDGGEVAKTARLLLHDGGPLPSISSSSLGRSSPPTSRSPFPLHLLPGGSQQPPGGCATGCACCWRTDCFGCWVSSLCCAQRLYLPMEVRTLVVDSLTPPIHGPGWRLLHRHHTTHRVRRG
jgi:hypothetical protein